MIIENDEEFSNQPWVPHIDEQCSNVGSGPSLILAGELDIGRKFQHKRGCAPVMRRTSLPGVRAWNKFPGPMQWHKAWWNGAIEQNLGVWQFSISLQSSCVRRPNHSKTHLTGGVK